MTTKNPMFHTVTNKIDHHSRGMLFLQVGVEHVEGIQHVGSTFLLAGRCSGNIIHGSCLPTIVGSQSIGPCVSVVKCL